MSGIPARWRAGEGLPGLLVIDGHTHIQAWPHGVNYDTVEQAVSDAVEAMDANGVDAACVLSGGYMVSGVDYTMGNDLLARMVEMASGRLIGFAHINPNDTRASVAAELERIYRMGFRCIKLLNAYQQGYPGDGPNLMAVYEFAAGYNMLILNHFWPNELLARIAAQFPTVDFITGHYGASQDALLRELPNVYASIWTLDSLGFLERGVRNVGPHKFLFGSDAFMNPVSVGIGPVVYADIPDEHKRLILGVTQARLLDKVGALPTTLKETYGV